MDNSQIGLEQHLPSGNVYLWKIISFNWKKVGNHQFSLEQKPSLFEWRHFQWQTVSQGITRLGQPGAGAAAITPTFGVQHLHVADKLGKETHLVAVALAGRSEVF